MELNNSLPPEERENNIVQQLVAKYLTYWPLFIVLLIVSLFGAFIYLRYATPIYEATATLIIKDESRGGNDDAQLNQLLNLVSSKKNIENEIEVLKSRGLMEKVVKELHLYAPVSLAGKVKASDGYKVSPVIVEVQDFDSLIEHDKVNFSYDISRNVVILEGEYQYPLNKPVNTPFGTLIFKPNKYYFPSSKNAVRPLYFSLVDPESMAIKYIKSLEVLPNKQSAMVDIGIKDPVPQRAVDIINQLITTYNLVSISEKNTTARNSLEFVNQQLSQISHELDSIESKVQVYKSGRGAVDIGGQGTRYLANVSDNDQRLADINLQLSIISEVEKFVINNQRGDLLAPSTLGLKDESLALLLKQLQNTEIDHAKLNKTVGGNNPNLLAMGEQIKKLRAAILENIQSQKQSLAVSRQSISSTNSGYNTMLSTVPLKERQLLEISREQLTKNSQYQFLLQKKQEAEMSLASVVSNSRVVDRALVGKDPVSPKRMKIYLMAVVAALGMGIGLITARDLLTTKIKYRTDIEKMVSIPIIGEVAYTKSDTALVIEKGTRSFVAEEFRKLRISLPFLGINSHNRKLLVTSSISGEGKSFIASNLAVTMSLIGKKVVLVDMDLNKPTLSDILDVHYEFGVSEFLRDEKQPEEIINKLEHLDNMYFISAGHLPDNPTEILASGKIKSLIDYLDSQFDLVVIDTSPALLVTDAYIISGMCDATLYVIRHDYSPKLMVKRMDETFQVNPLNNPAIIFNGVKSRGVMKNTYGYGYHYVYDKKYGTQKKSNKSKKNKRTSL